MRSSLTLHLLHAHPSSLPHHRLLVRYTRSIFGGGLCLTPDPNVVLRALAQKGSTVQWVELEGDAELAVNLDLAFEDQSRRVRQAIESTRRWLGWSDSIEGKQGTLSTLVSPSHPPAPVHPTKTMEVHACLAHHGIWLLHSNRRGLGQAGRIDELHNYCALSQAHVALRGSFGRTTPDLQGILSRTMGTHRSVFVRYLPSNLVAAA